MSHFIDCPPIFSTVLPSLYFSSGIRATLAEGNVMLSAHSSMKCKDYQAGRKRTLIASLSRSSNVVLRLVDDNVLMLYVS